MKKNCTLAALLCTLFIINAHAQPKGLPTEGPSFYFNSFQKYKDDHVDSALYYVNKLASDKSYASMLNDLIHNSFAQSFRRDMAKRYANGPKREAYLKRVANAHLILKGLLASDNQELKDMAQPIYYWVQVQENINDEKRLQELVAEFSKDLLSKNDLYTNRVGRYALLIHQEIEQKPSLQPAAQQLLTQVTEHVKKNQVTVDGKTPETELRTLLPKRAWYRFIYAYLNSREGNALLANNKIAEAGPYLKLAFEYSPDMLDITRGRNYYYDMAFLTGKEDAPFRSEYTSYLHSYPSKILISPQGKYLVIPFGTDWVDYIKQYADL